MPGHKEAFPTCRGWDIYRRDADHGPDVTDNTNRTTLIIAAVILFGFGAGLYFMPTIMHAIGSWSPLAAGIFAVLFVAAFFFVFWLRGRYQQRHR